jgi:hypothetical protein
MDWQPVLTHRPALIFQFMAKLSDLPCRAETLDDLDPPGVNGRRFGTSSM